MALQTRTTTPPVLRPLSNSLDRLVFAFVMDVDPNADSRYQLPWNFGPFLEEVPRRLGYNESLDAAAEALLTAYGTFRAPQKEQHELSMRQYSRALNALRRCLSTPETAHSSETLCSVMLLMIYEVQFVP